MEEKKMLSVEEAYWHSETETLTVKTVKKTGSFWEYFIQRFEFDEGLSVIQDLEKDYPSPQMRLEFVSTDGRDSIQPIRDIFFWCSRAVRVRGKGILHVRRSGDLKIVF